MVCAIPLLFSCGGGGGGGSSTSTVTGVAAVGAPIDGVVSLKDSTGTTKQTTTNATTGEFSIDVTGLTPPFILRAQKSNGDFLYSVALSTGLANINPLSNVIMGAVSNTAGTGTDPNSLYQAFATRSSRISKSTVDTATSNVYSNLTTEFKAKLGSIDFDPIYATFRIGNALDKAFDAYTIVYDSNSGFFQEQDTKNITQKTFGTLGKVTKLSEVGGTYTGTVRIGSNDRTIYANIDNKGGVIIYIDPEYVLSGDLVFRSGALSGTGVMYKLNSTGLSSYSSGNAQDVSISVSIASDTSLRVAITGQISTSPTSLTLSPSVSLTYGNNLKGAAASFAKAVGPFDLTATHSKQTGTTRVRDSKIYLTDDTVDNVNCLVSHTWSVQLSDLEQSLYAVEFKETVRDYIFTCSKSSTRDTQGAGIFVGTGMLVLLADKASIDNVNNQYQFVVAKIFK